MLLHGTRLIHTPIMGLQTGTELAVTVQPIIDPRTLAIIAYEVDGPLLDTKPSLLRIEDIRELSDIGMIIDSSEEFVELDDVIKLKEVYLYHFRLLDLPVIDEHGRKLGKVTDYTFDPKSFVIQQINVRRPLLQSLNESELLIHRSQITEINDQAIIVRLATAPPEPLKGKVRNYTNPFRSQTPQPESIDRE